MTKREVIKSFPSIEYIADTGHKTSIKITVELSKLVDKLFTIAIITRKYRNGEMEPEIVRESYKIEHFNSYTNAYTHVIKIVKDRHPILRKFF